MLDNYSRFLISIIYAKTTVGYFHGIEYFPSLSALAGSSQTLYKLQRYVQRPCGTERKEHKKLLMLNNYLPFYFIFSLENM